MRAVGRIFFATSLVSILLLSTSCILLPNKVKTPGTGYRQVGLASWYGPGFHGRKTSNGEVFDMHGFTAAHRTLAFGSILEVKNRDNGRRVRVRINDRGPFVRGRILDLSYAAAKSLDLIGTGTAPVEIRVVGFEQGLASPGGNFGGAGYTVQVGAFIQQENALRLKADLEKRYHPVYIVSHEASDQRYYRVRVGRLPTEEQANQLASKLSGRENLDTFVVRED